MPGSKGFLFLERAPAPRQKDVLVPAIARLARRHLARVTDKNDLDLAFEQALAKHPAITDALLRKLADDYDAIPQATKTRHFLALETGAGPLAPISSAGRRVRPDVTRWPNIDVLPWVNSILPTQPQQGWVPGQPLTFDGGGYAEDASGDLIEIWRLDPDNDHKVYDRKPTSASTSQLTWTLPEDIAPGMWHARVVVNGTKTMDGFVPFLVAAPQLHIDSVTPIDSAWRRPWWKPSAT